MADYKFSTSHFMKLQDYIQNGSKDHLTEKEQQYLDVLFVLNSMRRKYGRENAINFIRKPPFNIEYRKARTMYDEAINLFYADDSIEKQAHRNALFEEMLSAATLVKATAKNARDMEVYADMIAKAYKIKGLDLPDPPQIPEELYKKPIKIYSLNPKAISMAEESRTDIAALIDEIDISEREKIRLKQEAGVEDVNFEELLDEQEGKIESK